MKQVRKEEKKLQKTASKFESARNAYDDDDDDEFFNPTDLQLKRKETLLVKAESILKKSRVGTSTVQESYPFVFDSKLEIKSTAGNCIFLCLV
jgi:hypothetical protein